MVRNRPARPVTWLLIIAGVTTFAPGDVTYDVLTRLLYESNPVPSLADAFYIATYLLLSAGLLTMAPFRRRRDGETGALLDALIITTGLGVLSWVYLIELGCENSQGYLFARVAGPDDVAEVLRRLQHTPSPIPTTV